MSKKLRILNIASNFKCGVNNEKWRFTQLGCTFVFNPLSASDGNSCHDDIVTSDGCRALYRRNHRKNGSVFKSWENLLQNGILHFMLLG